MKNAQGNKFSFQKFYTCIKLILNNSFFLIVINIFLILFIIVKKIEKENNIINSEKKSDIIDFKNKGFFEIKNKSKKNRKLNYNNKNKLDYFSIVINKRNEGKNFLIRIMNHLRNFIKITKYIILLNFFNNIFVNNKISFIEYNSYNITLKIKGTGTKKIFSSETSFFKREYYPNEVHINGYKQNGVTYNYYLNETDNVIGLIWYDLISSCNCMFDGCSNIISIDLSNFNTTSDFDINSSNYKTGWYLWSCHTPPTLYSGPPFNYSNLKTNLSEVKDEIVIEMNMKKRTLKFIINNKDQGESYTNIPMDKPLFPAVCLYNK